MILAVVMTPFLGFQIEQRWAGEKKFKKEEKKN